MVIGAWRWGAAMAVGAMALSAPARDAAGEPSHHTGSNPGQVSPAGMDSLAKPRRDRWDVRTLAAFLTADRMFDDAGERAPLAAAGGIQGYSLTAYVEYQVATRWALSASTGGQLLLIDGMTGVTGGDTVWSLTDSYVAGRFTHPVRWGSASLIASVKIPGTYPESEATGTKQLDQETKVVLAVHELGSPRVSIVVGAGYKLRLGGIKDEITPSIVVPVRVTAAWTATASLMGGIAVGHGLAKDTLAPGLNVAFRVRSGMAVWAAYFRTVYGHNVVDATIAQAGFALSF